MMNKWKFLLVVVGCFLIPVLGSAEANPILIPEWWNAPVEVIIDARDRLNRAIVDKGGEAVVTNSTEQASQNPGTNEGQANMPDAGSNQEQFNSTESNGLSLASTNSSTASGNIQTNDKVQYAKCTGNNVNVRVRPDKSSNSIGQIKRNEIVYVFDYGNGDKETAWAHISTAVGEGYVLAKYLEATDQIDGELSTASSGNREVEKKKTPEVSEKDKEKEYKAKCKKLDYTKIERNPDKYKGEYAKVSGKVIQVSEGWFNTVVCRVRESRDKIWYVSYTRKDGESRILEDDSVTFYGICDGVTTYTALFGNSITIPKLNAEYLTMK